MTVIKFDTLKTALNRGTVKIFNRYLLQSLKDLRANAWITLRQIR